MGLLGIVKRTTSWDGGSDQLTRRHGGAVTRVYGHAVEGWTAKLSARQAARLAADPAVATVEADQTISTAATHQDFGGRAGYGYDAIDGDNVAQDGNGHGTFVVGVRVLNNSGSGTTAGVIAGIDWVTANAARAGPSPTSASVAAPAPPWTPPYAGRSPPASRSGVNAASTSPARVTEALTVGATPGASVTTVNSAIVAAATTGVVTNPGSGSPNRLLHTPSLSS